MPKRIEKLAFQTFRGGCQPVTFEFKPDKNIVLIFGENGTGKSSIADAIDFVCNSQWGSLADRSGTTPKTHIVSLNGQPKELAVELKYGGQTWRAALQSGKPVTQPANPPRAFILRRSDITRVMEAQPSERYKALHAYITVGRVEAAEGELRKAHKVMQADVDRAVQSRHQAGDALERLWLAEGKPDASALAWATHKTTGNVAAQKAALDANRRLAGGIVQAQAARQALATATQQTATAAATLAQAEATLQAAAAEQAGQNGMLVALLEEAQRYLSGQAPGEAPCPLCGKAEQQGVLLRRVQGQLQQLNHMQQLHAGRQGASRDLDKAQGAQQNAGAALVKQCRDLVGLLLDAGGDWAEVVDTDALTAAGGEAPALAQALTALDNLAKLQPRLADAIEDDQKTVTLWNALHNHLQEIRSADQVLAEQAAAAQRLRSLLEIVEGERKLYVDQLVRAISSDVNALYQRIHPQEPLGDSTLYVKPNVTGSLELRGAFGGVADVVPGAYYSEAHLDTLGLCVYLALAKRNGGNQVVVLDDVLTSVDEEHLSRIIQLVEEEAEQWGQLVITTHSRAWFDKWRQADAPPADLIELNRWNLANGIRHNRSVLPVDELRQALDADRLQRQTVASSAGVLLELLLDDLTLRYRGRVPRKRPADYTLKELGDALDSKLSKLLTVERQQPDGVWLRMPLKELIDKCVDYGWVRNQLGAHFNLHSSGIPDSMVREFGAHVLSLADAMICPHCKQLPKKNKSGEYWECGNGCGKTRLRPLQAPG